MVQRVIPHVWCDGTAEEAGAFYASAFPSTTARVTSRYPDDVPDVAGGPAMAGRPVTVEVLLRGCPLVLINAGAEYRPTPAISFIINFDPLMFDGSEDSARAALDEAWRVLSDGGEVRMDLGEYPHSDHYGWIEDRFGVNWQLMLTNPEGEPRPFVVPQLLFTGPAQNKAREARDMYVSLLPGSRLGHAVEYPAAQGLVDAGALMFADFMVGDTWLSVMDSPVEHKFGFTPGVSLAVMCDDQAEIDRLWNALSAVPEAEMCGWLVDRFGVSWQILPAQMEQLLNRPGAHARMYEMKKLIIADF